MSHSKKLKVVAAPFVLSMVLAATAVVADSAGKTSHPIKNCETVRTENLAPEKPVADAKSPDGSMRAEHPMRVRVPVEPCEPPRKRTPKPIK